MANGSFIEVEKNYLLWAEHALFHDDQSFIWYYECV